MDALGRIRGRPDRLGATYVVPSILMVHTDRGKVVCEEGTGEALAVDTPAPAWTIPPADAYPLPCRLRCDCFAREDAAHTAELRKGGSGNRRRRHRARRSVAIPATHCAGVRSGWVGRCWECAAMPSGMALSWTAIKRVFNRTHR